ncbi:MAG: S8 family peptidase [Pseudomonadota bacterium]
MADDPKPQGDERPEQFSIPPELVEHLLLGPADDRRVLQDSPLLGDVWAAYALDPGKVQDVLITPHKNATAARIARAIPKAIDVWAGERGRVAEFAPADRPRVRPKVAYLQGLVGARLYFDQVLRILVPRTQWWHEPKVTDRIAKVDVGPDGKEGMLKKLLARAPKKSTTASDNVSENFTSLQRYIALAGLIHWVGTLKRPIDPRTAKPVEDLELRTVDQAFQLYEPFMGEIVASMLKLYPIVKENPKALAPTVSKERDDADDNPVAIFQVSLNRIATPALERSVPAVKADAAHSLFRVNCRNIVWAVLDSGIQNDHDAFMTSEDDPAKRKSRVRKIFDFTNIREIVSSETADVDPETLKKLKDTTGLSAENVDEHLKTIALDFEHERPLDWATVEKLIMVKPDKSEKLGSPHGTHVAGIIGAHQFGNNKTDAKYAGGMCPDIGLYDFRVLGKSQEDTEFAVIAALQYIRYVNERHNYITIHGANLSLSIPHSVRNFACGRTPVCNECERLVESGVVVVAAAGNRGYQRFETRDGPFESYAAFSITDPGNADGVITVGSTHGTWPHTYGVSFFSSRGPTGDGRAKPDLVAPGERVLSTVPGNDWAPESGTSMSAPLVSGAAAMLLARYEELIGQPRRVKRILCESATDLGRERSFQGHGMLDVLRALQSI